MRATWPIIAVATHSAILALSLAVLLLALGANSSQAQQGTMHNCPQASKWAIAIWDGPDGTDTGQAASTCGQGSVVAAYDLNSETQMWSRWFVGRPEVSDLATLSNRGGVLILGSASAAQSTPTATATPMPTATRTPTATPTATPSGAMALVDYLNWAGTVFDDMADLMGRGDIAMDDWWDATPGSSAEADAVHRLYGIASEANGIYHEALTVHPPQGWEGFHADLLTALDACVEMLDLIAEGMDEYDFDKLDEAVEMIDDIVNMIAILTARLDQASSLLASSAEAQQGTMHNCPLPGKWAIAVWDGSATETGQALLACGDGAVVAAYDLNPQTQVWSRWFAGRPEMSTLETLDSMQGVIALGGLPSPTPTPAPTPTPTPPGPTGLAAWSGEWSAATDFGQLGFTVNPEGTAITKFVLDFSEFECGPVTRSGRVTLEALDPSLWPIAGRQFSAEFDVGLELKDHWTIGGEFDEIGTHTSGTWEVDSAGTICSGTWEAFR
jgi:hypothetical protein